MSENTTRIVDLPENITMQMSQGAVQFPNNGMMNQNGGMNQNFESQNPTYAPMNVHPNPYGNSIQPNVMPLPQSQHQQQSNVPVYLPQEQQTMLQNIPQVRLPSRDIPMDPSIYQNDEEIQPNYIPKPKLTSDYVKEYEKITEEKIDSYKKKKQHDSYVDKLLSDLQIPILVATLFFIFQMPMVNSMFYKRFSFLSIYNSDGNINFYGITVKSILFGAIFYSLQKVIDFMTDF